MRRGLVSRVEIVVVAVIATMAVSGCGTTKMSGTARTGTEQLLLTNAWDDALKQVDFRALAGVPVYLDSTNVTAVDQGWVVSSLRQSMIEQGVLLKTKPEQAQWIVEARVGAYGTDDYNWMVGVQQTTVPQTITGMPSGTIPEMPFIKKSNQQAIAKLALFAYDRVNGNCVWESGTKLATADARDVYIGGIGPIQSGSIRPKKNLGIGVGIPMLNDPEAAAGDSASSNPGAKPAAPKSSPPTMALPASASDLGSFRPD